MTKFKYIIIESNTLLSIIWLNEKKKVLKGLCYYLWKCGAQNLADSWYQTGKESGFGIQFLSGITHTTSQNTTQNVPKYPSTI